MSIRLMSRCWETQLPTPSHKLVLLKLADHANDYGYAYPGVVGIAKACGLHDRSIRRILSDLRKLGVIKISEEENPETKKPITYRITIDTHVIPTPDIGVHAPLTSASMTPDTHVKETIIEPSVEPSDIYIDGFKEFYELYPRKKSPLKAKAAYLKARKETDHESIIRGLREYIAHICREGTEDKFIKHPATWLNGGCWADDYTSPTNATGTGSSATGYERGLMAAIARGQRHEGGF